jgi:hypothetical protein
MNLDANNVTSGQGNDALMIQNTWFMTYVRLPLVTGTNTYAGILTPSTNVPFADRKSTTKVFDP